MHAAKPEGEDRESVERLASLLKRKSDRFKEDKNNTKLLDLYVDKYPQPPIETEIVDVLKGGRSRRSIDLPVFRFRQGLDDFKANRDLWDESQKRLFLCPAGPLKGALSVGPLGAILEPTTVFWYHQCCGIPSPGKKGNQKTDAPYIVLSEPLFFFCPELGAYMRLLASNFDGSLELGGEGQIVETAKEMLLRQVGDEPTDVRRFVETLNLRPVRLYLPVGDSYAKTSIRRWFRTTMSHHLGYRVQTTEDERRNSNLIVLASRSSMPLLIEFQAQEPKLRLRLCDKGIMFDGKELSDETPHCQSKSLARVVVTQWRTARGKCRTFLASHHTRAIEAVANMLVDDSSELMKSIAASLVSPKTAFRIPANFQLAFEVPLIEHETGAGLPVLLPDMDGEPLIYET